MNTTVLAMFSVDLKINAILIAHLYGHNKGPVLADPDICSYYIEYHRIGESKESPKVVSRLISHLREDGLEKLVIKSLEVLSS